MPTKVEKPVTSKKRKSKVEEINTIMDELSKLPDEPEFEENSVAASVESLASKFDEEEKKKEQADHDLEIIKKLKDKLVNGTISDGEAAELFNLLSN